MIKLCEHCANSVNIDMRSALPVKYGAPLSVCLLVSQVPSTEYGLMLEFEGYELSRANYNQPCTQGQWVMQNRR